MSEPAAVAAEKDDGKETAVAGKKSSDDFEFHHKDAKKPSIIHIIFLNRTLRILSVLGIFCILLPIVDYFYFYNSEITEYEIVDGSGICSHYPIYQIPCGGENITELECIASACCFSHRTGCYHFLPSRYQLKYERDDRPWDGSGYWLPTWQLSPLKTPMTSRMKLDIRELSDDTLAIVLWNPDQDEVTFEARETFANPAFTYRVFTPELFVEVRRKIDNKTILSTSRGPLIVSDNYFEWSFHLNGTILMGFDDLVVEAGQRILINNEHSSVVPYVIAYDHNSKYYHGVHFESIDSPAQVQILQSNVIIIRQFHSSSFRLKLFTGPEYFDVHQQIIKHLPHYFPIHDSIWPLGVHYCRASHEGVLNETATKIELNHLLMDNNLGSLPFDSHCIDAELTALVLSQNITQTLDGYENVIEKLHEHNKKLLFHVSLSMIEVNSNESYHSEAFDDGKLFLKASAADDDDASAAASVFAGIYGKTRKVSYFDYLTKSHEIADWLIQRWLELDDTLNSADGFFVYKTYLPDDTLDSPDKSLDYLKFKPTELAESVENLVPLSLRANDGKLLIHQLNNYGRQLVEAFQSSVNGGGGGKEEDGKFCIADSYRETSKCALLFKEAKPSWTALKMLVRKSVLYAAIGISFYGGEVCGSNQGGKVREDLCIRWYQFAIFTPLFYVNSDRMPLKFSKYAERVMVRAIRVRYSLLGYMRMYLMMRRPLLRPMHFVYPEMDVDESFKQFMFGDSLAIVPIVDPLVVELELTFPERYFELWSGIELPLNTTHFAIVISDIPVFVREGHIVALHLAHDSLTAHHARLQPYQVIVALSCSERYSCHAQGELVLSAELKFEFVANENHFNISMIATNSSDARRALCDLPTVSSSFQLAKIYGLGEFKAKYRNDYLSLDLNLCESSSESFSFAI